MFDVHPGDRFYLFHAERLDVALAVIELLLAAGLEAIAKAAPDDIAGRPPRAST